MRKFLHLKIYFFQGSNLLILSSQVARYLQSWDPYHQTDKDKLEKIQRRAARFVMGDYKTTSSVSAMLTTLNWPLLEERRQENRQKMLQKILNDEVAVNHNNTLKPATSRSRRTHSYQLSVIASSRDYRRESFFPRAIREWNAQPKDFQPRGSQQFFGTAQGQCSFFFSQCC